MRATSKDDSKVACEALKDDADDGTEEDREAGEQAKQACDAATDRD